MGQCPAALADVPSDMAVSGNDTGLSVDGAPEGGCRSSMPSFLSAMGEGSEPRSLFPSIGTQLVRPRGG